MSKIVCKSVQRPAIGAIGRTEVSLDDGANLGHINVEFGGLFFYAHTPNGWHIGTFSSKVQAAKALRRDWAITEHE